ncbi:hypothetical protein CWI36_1527p0010 [Hamiltosporidium magnivora]|uniref:Uncharacterized protein n=1 Tax=Hamiltosporidium magnivora TaxID=148818 RepID=A0A4Q9L0F8_9MICR|nr:hypothetical protein CWI36_1527p0010 [Hamiltosporidium magnivora]
MLMTRSKVELNNHEPLPNFLINNVDLPKPYSEMLSIISNNKLDNINHSWIKNIEIERFSKAVQQRLHSGIAGSRLFNIFRSNIPKNLNTYSDDLINIYNIVKKGR